MLANTTRPWAEKISSVETGIAHLALHVGAGGPACNHSVGQALVQPLLHHQPQQQGSRQVVNSLPHKVDGEGFANPVPRVVVGPGVNKAIIRKLPTYSVVQRRNNFTYP